jgi:undecaprenyl-diphosphatase
LLASYLVIARPAWSVRWEQWCVTMVLLVAFSRVYLGAHYVSDVLAAMARAWRGWRCASRLSPRCAAGEGKTV